MQFFESFDKTSIAYRYFSGKGPRALFALHGWTADSSTLMMLKKGLPDTPLFLWDARCHGKSAVDEKATIEKMARDLRFFIDHVYDLSIPLTVLGHSMGALTLWESLKNFGSEKIDRIIVIDQSPKLTTDSGWNLGIYGNYSETKNAEMISFFEKDLGDGVIRLSTSGLNEEYNRVFQAHPEFFYERKRTFTPAQARGMVSIWKTLCQADYRESIENIKIPALLLYGEKSQYYKKETAFFVAEKIKNSTLHFFSKGDHSPFVQQPEEFCQAIRDFLA